MTSGKSERRVFCGLITVAVSSPQEEQSCGIQLMEDDRFAYQERATPIQPHEDQQEERVEKLQWRRGSRKQLTDSGRQDKKQQGGLPVARGGHMNAPGCGEKSPGSPELLAASFTVTKQLQAKGNGGYGSSRAREDTSRHWGKESFAWAEIPWRELVHPAAPRLVWLRTHHQFQCSPCYYLRVTQPGTVQRFAVQGSGLHVNVLG